MLFSNIHEQEITFGYQLSPILLQFCDGKINSCGCCFQAVLASLPRYRVP